MELLETGSLALPQNKISVTKVFRKFFMMILEEVIPLDAFLDII